MGDVVDSTHIHILNKGKATRKAEEGTNRDNF